MRDILQSLGPVVSLQPVSTDVPCLLRTMNASCVKVTAQSVSHSGTTPIKVRRKPGIRCPLSGNNSGRWGKSRSPVPVDFSFFPVSAPTVTFGAALSMLTTGASVEK